MGRRHLVQRKRQHSDMGRASVDRQEQHEDLRFNVDVDGHLSSRSFSNPLATLMHCHPAQFNGGIGG